MRGVGGVVGNDEEMSVVDAEVFNVARRPRGQLLVDAEPMTPATPGVDERLGRALTTGSAIRHRQIQLPTAYNHKATAHLTGA